MAFYPLLLLVYPQPIEFILAVRLSGCFLAPKTAALRLQGIDPVDPTGLQLDGGHQDSSCASVPPMDGWGGWDGWDGWCLVTWVTWVHTTFPTFSRVGRLGRWINFWVARFARWQFWWWTTRFGKFQATGFTGILGLFWDNDNTIFFPDDDKIPEWSKQHLA